MFDDLIYITGFLLILIGIHQWVTANNDFFLKGKVPFVKPYFLFGNTGGFFFRRYSAPEFIRTLYNTFPDAKIFGFYDWRTPFFFIRDPETIKKLTIKEFDHFEDHRSFIDNNRDILFGNSLFMLKGQKWRDMRATLSPAFTGSKMRQMFELVSECADDMAKHFIAKAEKGERLNFEMKELFSRYTNDVIASSAFGIKVNSFEDPNNEFLLMGRHAMNFSSPISIARFLLLKTLPTSFNLNLNFFDSKTINFFSSMVLKNMKIREEKQIFRPDMINMLMQVRKGTLVNEEKEQPVIEEGFSTVQESEVGKATVRRQWSDIEIVAQCFLFFLAGFDTSSTLLTFMAYELAIHPEIQEKLYKEIYETYQTVGDGKTLQYDVLQKMKYLDQVTSETLRKWPPAFFTDRLCVKDYVVNDNGHRFIITKGSAIWIPISALHHDPKYFPEPDKFDPERFNDENKANIISGSYIPFGVGPRNCIGSRFALMEVKALVYYLLLHFRIVPNEHTQIPIKLKKTPFTTATERGMDLEFKLRNNN